MHPRKEIDKNEVSSSLTHRPSMCSLRLTSVIVLDCSRKDEVLVIGWLVNTTPAIARQHSGEWLCAIAETGDSLPSKTAAALAYLSDIGAIEEWPR